jgi:hypothetical protein
MAPPKQSIDWAFEFPPEREPFRGSDAVVGVPALPVASVVLKGGAADDSVAVVAADPRGALLGDDDCARQQFGPVDDVRNGLAILHPSEAAVMSIAISSVGTRYLIISEQRLYL